MLRNHDIAKLFTSRSITSIIGGDFSMVSKIAENYKISKKKYNLSDFFDLTLEQISIEYKSEYFYKNMIAKKLFLEKYGNQATMLSEFRIGSNKADCVILNGKSKCYEIKTEFDSLDRLPEQLNSYTGVFDRVYVVTAEKHLIKVLDLAPDTVGVIQMSDNGELINVRTAKDLEVNVDYKAMFHSLRKKEYLNIIKNYFNDIPTASNMDIFNVCLQKFQKIPSDDLRLLFTETLKKYRANNFEFIEKLPGSLVSSAISYNIPKNKQTKLIESLDIPLKKILK